MVDCVSKTQHHCLEPRLIFIEQMFVFIQTCTVHTLYMYIMYITHLVNYTYSMCLFVLPDWINVIDCLFGWAKITSGIIYWEKITWDACFYPFCVCILAKTVSWVKCSCTYMYMYSCTTCTCTCTVQLNLEVTSKTHRQRARRYD